MDAELHARWLGLWARRAEHGDAARPDTQLYLVWNAIVARYTEAHRAYHTRGHLKHCFAELDASPQRPAQIDVFELALWFHDAVYNPRDVRPGGNEYASAAFFAEQASDIGLPGDMGPAVIKLIVATHHGSRWDDRDPATPDRNLLLDVDLSILGQPPERYGAYARQVRREYDHVDDVAFRAGRERVLRYFLGLPRVYRTAAFASRYEKPARANLEAELMSLGD